MSIYTILTTPNYLITQSSDQIRFQGLPNSATEINHVLVISDKELPSIMSIAFLEKSKQIFIACGNQVFCSLVDISKSAVREHLDLKNCELLFTAPEDINDLKLDKSSNRMAISCDNGHVWVVDVISKTFVKSRQFHDSIVSCSVFRTTLPWHLISGGFDCKLILWDFSRGISKYEHYFTSEAAFNPPHVHSLTVSIDGNIAAAGLGNGEISILKLPRNFKNMQQSISTGSLRGHTWSVSAIVFIENDLLLSGSLDKTIRFWNLKDPTKNRVMEVGFKVNDLAFVNNTIIVGGMSKELTFIDQSHLF